MELKYKEECWVQIGRAVSRYFIQALVNKRGSGSDQKTYLKNGFRAIIFLSSFGQM